MLNWLKRLFGLAFTNISPKEAQNRLAAHPPPLVRVAAALKE